jgi:hypothetical protein
LARPALQAAASRWKDYAHSNKKRQMTLTAHEFIRRLVIDHAEKTATAN